MADQKLSELTAGAAVAATDLFYSAQDIGGGSFSQVKQAASALRTYIAVAGIPPTQRSVTTSPITVASTDQVINCNIAAGTPACTLPLASTRAGVPLTIKDVGGQFAAHVLTLTPTAPDLIDGAATYVLSAAFGGVTLVPLNDGVNTGWFVR